MGIFSDIQVQLTPQSVVQAGRNSNSFFPKLKVTQKSIPKIEVSTDFTVINGKK